MVSFTPALPQPFLLRRTAFHEDNFYLTDEGFVFYYQSEAIAPHAAGIPEFTIPYTDLSDLTVR